MKILILGIIVGGVAVYFLMRKSPLRKSSAGGEESLIEIQAREKNLNKQKILKLLENSDRLENKQVEQELGVSDATAERYLDELEKEGQVRQVGNIGAEVYYEKV
jgi:Fic family protein